jgi:hypothetical protein
MERSIFKILLIAAATMACGAHADGAGAQFGIVYGMSVPDAENTNPYRMAGVKGEAFITPAFSAGGYYMMSDKSGEPSQLEKFRYSLHGVQSAYHIPSANGDTFVAFRVGLTKVKATPATSVDKTFSPYHYGIATGYDYHLTSWMSFGIEGAYLHVQRSRTSDTSGRFEQDSFNIINFMVTAQLRL